MKWRRVEWLKYGIRRQHDLRLVPFKLCKTCCKTRFFILFFRFSVSWFLFSLSYAVHFNCDCSVHWDFLHFSCIFLRSGKFADHFFFFYFFFFFFFGKMEGRWQYFINLKFYFKIFKSQQMFLKIIPLTPHFHLCSS